MFRYLSFIFTAVFFMTMSHHGLSAVSSKRKPSRVSTTSLIVKYDEVTGYDQIFLRTSLYEDIPLTHSPSDKLVVVAGPRVGGFVTDNSVSFHEDVCDAGWLFYYSDVSGGVYVGCVDEALNVITDIECDICDVNGMGVPVIEYPEEWEDEPLPDDFPDSNFSSEPSDESGDLGDEAGMEENEGGGSGTDDDIAEEDEMGDTSQEDSESAGGCTQDDEDEESTNQNCICQTNYDAGDVVTQVDFDLDIDLEFVGNFDEGGPVEEADGLDAAVVEENLVLEEEDSFGFQMTGGACALNTGSLPARHGHDVWFFGSMILAIFIVMRGGWIRRNQWKNDMR